MSGHVDPSYRFPFIGNRCEYRYCTRLLDEECFVIKSLNYKPVRFFCTEECKDSELKLILAEMDMTVFSTFH